MTDALQKIVDFLRFCFTWWFFIEPWEQGVRVRLGKHTKLYRTGVHFKIPFCDVLYVHNTRRMICVPQAQTLSSSDGKVFVIGVTISYCIIDVFKLHATVHSPEAIVAQKAGQLVAEYVSQRRFCEILPQEIHEMVQKRLNLDKFGLGEIEVCVNNFAAVKTFRLIQDGMGVWQDGNLSLSTTRRS